MGNDNDIFRRKAEQLNIVCKKPVEFNCLTTGFEAYKFVHQALPEINLNEVDLSTKLFGKTLKAPIIISSMVGGIDAAGAINQNLAQAARTLGLAMGVGSQRCAIDNSDATATFQVRRIAHDILLFANLGAIQLNNGYTIDDCRRAVEMIEADALILHLNPLHEAFQRDGNTNFRGLLKKIEEVCHALPAPVVVKEVGFGISDEVAKELARAGVSGIDVAGAGGTSWSEVERHRAPTEAENRVCGHFCSWGIPTAESLVMARIGAPNTALIASGGIRTGTDAAIAIALGAHVVGIGLPLLKAAALSTEAVVTQIQEIISGLRIAMFCVGAVDLKTLRNTRFLRKKVDSYTT